MINKHCAYKQNKKVKQSKRTAEYFQRYTRDADKHSPTTYKYCRYCQVDAHILYTGLGEPVNIQEVEILAYTATMRLNKSF